MKHIFQQVAEPLLPEMITKREDKMGFPTPLTQWLQGEARTFVHDVFSSERAQGRALIDNRKVLDQITNESQFGRKTWGLLCLELWQQEFHDKANEFKYRPQ